MRSIAKRLDFSEIRNRDLADQIGISLIFLFPIFAVTVRHWASTIFILLCIVALWRMKAALSEVLLNDFEKVWLASWALFFVSYVVSSLLNGWDEGSWRILEREIRFLAIVPIYLYLRLLGNPLRWLGMGALIGIPINFVVVTYEVWGLGLDRGHAGIYGNLFSGPMTVLLLIAATAYLHSLPQGTKRQWFLLAVIAVVSVVAIQMSRSAVLGLAVWLVIYYGWVIRRQALVMVFMAVLLGAAAVVSQLASNVMPSFGKGIGEFTAYWDHEFSGSNEPNPQVSTSIGTRMEMLRSVTYIACDYPVFGVGGYNFGNVVNSYIEAGKIDASLKGANHPHNVLAEVLVSKGLVGLGIFLLMVGIPFWSFIRGGVDLRPVTAFFGLGFLLALMTMMMTESAIVLKGNFIATFILFLSAFFAQHRQTANE